MEVNQLKSGYNSETRNQYMKNILKDMDLEQNQIEYTQKEDNEFQNSDLPTLSLDKNPSNSEQNLQSMEQQIYNILFSEKDDENIIINNNNNTNNNNNNNNTNNQKSEAIQKQDKNTQQTTTNNCDKLEDCILVQKLESQFKLLQQQNLGKETQNQNYFQNQQNNQNSKRRQRKRKTKKQNSYNKQKVTQNSVRYKLLYIYLLEDIIVSSQKVEWSQIEEKLKQGLLIQNPNNLNIDISSKIEMGRIKEQYSKGKKNWQNLKKEESLKIKNFIEKNFPHKNKQECHTIEYISQQLSENNMKFSERSLFRFCKGKNIFVRKMIRQDIVINKKQVLKISEQENGCLILQLEDNSYEGQK